MALIATDHPRSRGVYSHDGIIPVHRKGSSPLARGLPPKAAGAGPGVGIIPARAGFTRPASPASGPTEDHPRSRGVYLQAGSARITGEGSSPLARGLRLPVLGQGDHPRIIPARAGFTTSTSFPRRCPRDHPRSRGVYGSAKIEFHYDGGSSPLARGLRETLHRRNKRVGIIPARAGFTG